ncbi:MAG: hypothetical protein CBB65_15035 [Hyphomonadaceae bacterium TMED5]|nr:hypothetical protein [Ponticaulis sp.]OUX97009.1 MAG: hypothetical protein CBB65_15035 [Hyphomonadaceae bacterium TMED5]
MFIFSKCYRPYTGVVQLRGPENIGLQRTIPAAASKSPVQSHLRITLENNEKIRPEPDRENAFARESGGASATGIELFSKFKSTQFKHRLLIGFIFVNRSKLVCPAKSD